MKTVSKNFDITTFAQTKETCPFCDSESSNFYYDDLRIEHDRAYQTITCHACDETFDTVYGFDGILFDEEIQSQAGDLIDALYVPAASHFGTETKTTLKTYLQIAASAYVEFGNEAEAAKVNQMIKFLGF